jgi:YesN/AraC family two-component response regulator
MNDRKKHDISVLYVEDEPATREEVVEILQRRVREVFTARDGSEGLVLFRERAPDLVVTDIRMPVMDGLMMARTIREEYKGALIIMVTAYSDTPYMLEAVDIGIDQYVVKPVKVEKLAAALDKCAEIIEYRRAHKRFIAEREKLIADLQKALAEIKTLHGILPICANCKKIRDDKGAWKQMESYISEHTDAVFSHGLCSECATKLYPRIFKSEEEAET